MTEHLPHVVDKNGVVRRLGTIPGAQNAFLGTFKSYAEAGKPMFTYEQLRLNARERDTRGRSKFDSSWIMNQKSHGSCNGFSIAGGLSRTRVRRGLERVMLSGAYAYSLMNGGNDNGSVLVDGMRNCQSRGIATAETVKWNQIYPRLYDKAKADAEADRFKGFECYQLTTELEVFSALAANFDVIVAMDVDDSTMRLNSEGVCGGGRGKGNHSTLLDGYTVLSNGQLAGDNPESWGLEYGDNGRAYLTWERHLAQCVNYHGFYAVRGALDDPQGDNPPDLLSSVASDETWTDPDDVA